MVDAPISTTPQDPQAAAVANPQAPAAPAPEPAMLDEPPLLEEPPLESPEASAPPPVPQGTFPTDSPMAAMAGGVAKAAFATKDFLTGGTPSEDDKSPTRKAIEANANASAESSTVNGLVSGIWLTDKGSQVDHEMNRMSLEQGVTIGPPPPSAHGGTDLRTIQMQDGSNAYDRLQELSAQPVPGMPRLKEALGNLINTDAYKNAPDGASNDRGTKPAMLLDQIGRYRNAASKIVSADPNVRKAEYDRQMKTAAAYSSKNANPSPGNQTSQMLDTLGKQFGVDMHGLAGGSGAPTPSPLPPGARPITQ